MRAKTDKIVRSWKASPEDMDILNSLKEAQVEASAPGSLQPYRK
jgi:hypothetical protein